MKSPNRLSGWGRYPVIDSNAMELNELLPLEPLPSGQPFIATGNLRSYGDAALAPLHYSSLRFNRFISFNDQTGLISCEAGVLLADIIEVFLPRGWFLAITPGTKLITVGGAVASDVHGKNHHIQGCFSECVESLELLLPKQQRLVCSRTENVALFHATCGGMGLTGVITRVSFYLKRVNSQWLEQTTVKTTNLAETFSAFEQYKNAPYSVAWIDCLAKGSELGRCLLMAGDFAGDGDLLYQPKRNLNIPFNFPTFTLNSWSVKAFNHLYYAKATAGTSQQRVGIDAFFYPLDAIQNWNRIYGKNGFVQWQFVLPKEASLEGLTSILKAVTEEGLGSFLAVLKLYGTHNSNWLSFPIEGYGLALDFKMQPGLVPFLTRLTDEVIAFGGRVYLAKDALLTQAQFERSYPSTNAFRQLRHQLGLTTSFQSLLSRRLDL